MNQSESHFYPSKNATPMYGHMSDHGRAPVYRYGAHAHAQHQQQQANQQKLYAQDPNQSTGSPVHEIYRKRSARSFTDILRSPAPAQADERRANRNYLQREEEEQASSIAALAAVAATRAALNLDGEDEGQPSRQERLLRRIELRLDRLEEQHERQLLHHPMRPPASSSTSDSRALADSITRLLDQMQSQQQQMHRMQQQMDELRHSMEMALLREKTTQSAVEALQKQQASTAANRVVNNDVAANNKTSEFDGTEGSSAAPSVDDSSNSSTTTTAFWLNTAVIVSILFAFIGLFVAIVAMMRANDSRRAQTSAEVAANNALAAAAAASSYYPLDLSRSGPVYPPYFSPQPYINSGRDRFDSGNQYFRDVRSPYISRQ